jgi:uncharacterized damage-inducible protein DinB
MQYDDSPIAESTIRRAAEPLLQHALDTYASETNKTASVWRQFQSDDLAYRPHDRSSTVAEIMKHQLLSERRFFGEFLAAPEPAPGDVLPGESTVAAFAARLVELARPRLEFLASRSREWWLESVPFFDVERQRVWIFWRRVLHSAHHRTQLTVYLRLLNRKVVATYGPTADVTWTGADPTTTVGAAGRK